MVEVTLVVTLCVVAPVLDEQQKKKKQNGVKSLNLAADGNDFEFHF